MAVVQSFTYLDIVNKIFQDSDGNYKYIMALRNLCPKENPIIPSPTGATEYVRGIYLLSTKYFITVKYIKDKDEYSIKILHLDLVDHDKQEIVLSYLDDTDVVEHVLYLFRNHIKDIKDKVKEASNM